MEEKKAFSEGVEKHNQMVLRALETKKQRIAADKDGFRAIEAERAKGPQQLQNIQKKVDHARSVSCFSLRKEGGKKENPDRVGFG